MATTSIEWTSTVNPDGTVTPGKTWNPVTGCTKVSPGCAHCYAEGVAERFWSTQYPYMRRQHPDDPARTQIRPRVFTDVMTHADRLDQPLRWKKPARIFVNSMSDLFHEDVPFEFIDQVFAVMARAPHHTFQVLTKRAERMHTYMNNADAGWRWTRHMTDIGGKTLDQWGEEVTTRRLKNVWLGVSVENQHFADERIPLLLQTPAAVRFISAEPLLGSVDLEPWLPVDTIGGVEMERWLDWVIVGGESGGLARPMCLSWMRNIVYDCKAAGVPVFVKQYGAKPYETSNSEDAHKTWPIDHFVKLKDRKGGDPSEWPEDLRVREWPKFQEMR